MPCSSADFGLACRPGGVVEILVENCPHLGCIFGADRVGADFECYAQPVGPHHPHRGFDRLSEVIDPEWQVAEFLDGVRESLQCLHVRLRAVAIEYVHSGHAKRVSLWDRPTCVACRWLPLSMGLVQ